MKSIIRKTEINWSHFFYGLPFLIVGILVYFFTNNWLFIPFLGLGVSYSIGEILFGENSEHATDSAKEEIQLRNKLTILYICVVISLFLPTGQTQEIRWLPGTWCGSHPPYTGTLFTGITFGFPFSWVEVGRLEKCTTIASLIPDYIFDINGLILNLMVLGAIWILLTYNHSYIAEKHEEVDRQ